MLEKEVHGKNVDDMQLNIEAEIEALRSNAEQITRKQVGQIAELEETLESVKQRNKDVSASLQSESEALSKQLQEELVEMHMKLVSLQRHKEQEEADFGTRRKRF